MSLAVLSAKPICFPLPLPVPFLQYATTRGLYHHLRKYVSKQSGLARLLTLRLAADAGLSPRLLCEVCGQEGIRHCSRPVTSPSV